MTEPNMTDTGARKLLRDMPAGLPADCLLARIRGRRSFLVRDWDRLLLTGQPLAALSAAPWRRTAFEVKGGALQQEYFWVFSRMEEQLRCAMAPFFWLAELHTLAVCLRLLSGGTTDLDQLLKNSLLANNIKALLRTANGSAPAVAGLVSVLAGCDPGFARLNDIYRTSGSGGLEAALYDISLQGLARTTLHPQIRSHLILMIDSRNLTTVAKHLRWRLSAAPPLLPGGSLPLARLAELFELRDSTGLLHLAMRLGGEASYSRAGDLERVLFEAQGRVMRRLSREPAGLGAILDYLWHCGNEAANIGLLERLSEVGSENIDVELRR